MSEGFQGVANKVYFDYANLAAISVLVYDALITFPDEVELLWRSKFKLPAALYTMARYPYIFVYLVGRIVELLPLNGAVRTCEKVIIFENGLFLLNRLGVHGLLILRTYAISNKNRWIFASLSCPVLISTVMLIIESLLPSCVPLTNAQQKTLDIEVDINNFSILALDTAAIVITIYYTVGINISWRTNWTSLTLHATLLKHGVIQYIFILTFGLTAMIAEAVNPPLGDKMIPMSNAMTTILICHFLLDIRRRNKQPNLSHTDPPPTMSRFQAAAQYFDDAIIGGFGETIAGSSLQNEVIQEETELEGSRTPV